MIQAANHNATISYSKWIRRMADDSRLLSSHISLFTGLFTCYGRSGFENPFPVKRKTLMAYSKIASIATYHKCIRELDAYGYIHYVPSFHPTKGSLVYWPDSSG